VSRAQSLRIHAICLALNESAFIENQLRTLYPFCSAISVVTQYDRNWYSEHVEPDGTVEVALRHPDPEGKIHLSVRRSLDEAAARNAEMLYFGRRSTRGIQAHARDLDKVQRFHGEPDYFLIVDADEFYDVDTLPGILDHLQKQQPRGMRVWGYNYVRSWNYRTPREVVPFCHFGFIRPGVLFEHRRCVSWNESRVAKLLKLLRMPDVSASLWGFIECPIEIGVFHHGCWLGGDQRLQTKIRNSSHRHDRHASTPENIADNVAALRTEFVPTEKLPRNIREADWPPGFLDRPGTGANRSIT
jgi:hypothetical protein